MRLLKKSVSMALSAIMILSCFLTVQAAPTTEEITRDVFVHALGATPTETKFETEVEVGDTVDVFLAVDEPNKGICKLNGYVVNFRYDPRVFELVNDPSNAIDVSLEGLLTGNVDTPDVGEDPDNVGSIDGFDMLVQDHGTGTTEIDGITYNTAYVVALINGQEFPDKKEGALWYNLCRLPLRVKSDAPISNTTVSINVFDYTPGDPEYGLGLLSKHDPENGVPLQFTTNPLNNGEFRFQIKQKNRPNVPTPSVRPGSYDTAQTVELLLDEADNDCTIYYTTDVTSANPQYIQYTGGIPVVATTSIKCYAERIWEGKSYRSNTVTYRYRIVPPAPLLRFEDKTLVDYFYTTDSPFQVIFDDDEDAENLINDANRIYYTYTDLSADNISATDDPETGWVEVSNSDPTTTVTKSGTMRIVTVRVSGEEQETSEVAQYFFNFMPQPVTANPEPQEGQQPVNVTLSTPTLGAEIYYTTNGSDPRNGGTLYNGTPISISKNTVLRAVAKYDGVYSEITSYYYKFGSMGTPVVSAFNLPGTYESQVKVSLTSTNVDDTIYYTLDGSDPTEDSDVYVNGQIMTITTDTEIRAFAVTKDGVKGEISVFDYRIKPKKPSITPTTMQFSQNGLVVIAAQETDTAQATFEIYYTLDGSNPIDSDTRIKLDKTGGMDNVTLNIKEYTRVSAVAIKTIVATGEQIYSDIATETYDVVVSKPAKPIATLASGSYIVENLEASDYTTKFKPVPEQSTIYYSIGTIQNPPADPVVGQDWTLEYTPDSDIALSGEVVIKAIVVDGFGVQSDVATYNYTIVPQIPYLPPSGDTDSAIASIPVQVAKGAQVEYTLTVGDQTITVVTEPVEDGMLYIDPQTGKAYLDEEKQTECTYITAPDEITSDSQNYTITVTSTLDGVESGENTGIYTVKPGEKVVAPVYANVDSGEYEEIVIGENSEDDPNYVLKTIALSCLSDGAKIQYRTDDAGDWQDYTAPINVNDDTTIWVRAVKEIGGEQVSSEIGYYVYTFVPVAPTVSPVSGTYVGSQDVKIDYDPRSPKYLIANNRYRIAYRKNGDKAPDSIFTDPGTVTIEHSMALKVRTVKDYGAEEEKTSESRFEYYVIEDASKSGSVFVDSPYFQPGRYQASAIDEYPYKNGIKLATLSQYTIMYNYSYYKVDADGNVSTTPIYVPTAEYLYTPIEANSSWRDLTINAWLVDENGEKVPNSDAVFEYEFVDMNAPVIEPDSGSYTSGTRVTITNEYPDREDIIIYYTTDGSDPADEQNQNRMEYTDESEIRITKAMTVRAVYCVKGEGTEANFYSLETSADYTIRRSGGGGGGGGVYRTPTPSPSPTPLPTGDGPYTQDIFGNENPVHIKYLYGYTDGTVQPEGNITREEVAAIIFRIMPDDYAEPKPVTGDVFPDVLANRWSAQSIECLADMDILVGYPEGVYLPSNKITRAEFATIVARYAKLEPIEGETTFEDCKDHWANGYINAIHQEELIVGYDDGTFRPNQNITRAEAVTIVNKILGRAPDTEYLKTRDFNPYSDLDESEWYYADILEATITHTYELSTEEKENPWLAVQ